MLRIIKQEGKREARRTGGECSGNTNVATAITNVVADATTIIINSMY